MSQAVDLAAARAYLMALQDQICSALEELDGGERFAALELPGERGGVARPRVLSDGEVLERAAVNFSHTAGAELPAAATVRNPQLAGCGFEAVSTSLIVHPRNPYAPTSHANLRLFRAQRDGEDVAWWFGGGFDLTPYYGFAEDAEHWHRTAEAACRPFGEQIYSRFKKDCDEYFYLPHRQETRGVGGLFFDDLDAPDFASCFALVRSIGDAYLPAYLPIVERRQGQPWGQQQRDFQLYRRGRYVEFNLIYDRGTLFGLQSGGRVESILASLPPQVSWLYDPQFERGSPEQQLAERFLVPRDWLPPS